MSSNIFMDKIRSFFGLKTEPPRNDFRNPIWSTDDDDDDDDELYSRQQIDVFKDPMEFHREFTRHMQDMFSSFGTMLGEMKTFLHDDPMNMFPPNPQITDERQQFNYSNNIRDHYLKPGYQNQRHENLEGDKDLDGQISSHDISDLLKKKDNQIVPSNRYDSVVSSKPFFETIITTSIIKADGSTETRKIVKKGNEIIEETITTTDPKNRMELSGTSEQILNSSNIIISELVKLFKPFY